ncbi:hypothetical protein JYT26_00200 [Beggiatoa alba]|nr:hypothetical protein [Beggiatoa alba]
MLTHCFILKQNVSDKKALNLKYWPLHMPLLVMVLLLAGFPRWATAETLADMLRAVRSTAVDVELNYPSEQELALAEKLFRRLFAGERGPDLRQQWAKLGFELTGTRTERVPLLVLQEFGEGATQNNFSGKGFFVFAVDREPKTVLQVLHSFQDAETEVIALDLMANGNFRAAAWNTAPAMVPAHPTFLPESFMPPAEDYILAFTRALMSVQPDKRVVQLHSFEKEKMYSISASHADIILSGYGEQPNQAVGWLGRCLKKEMDYTVRTFPFEVQEMGAGNKMAGASYNAVGELMQAAGSQGFLHLSMGGMFRKELRAYPDVQKKLFACLNQE